MNLCNVKSALSAAVSTVRRGILITLLVLACDTGFGLPPRGAMAAAAATRQTAPPPCVGDCDNGGTVTVDEIIIGVNIALGLLALAQCPAFDCDATGQVTVSCIIQAVDAAMNGCGSEPTPDPTLSTTPTPTSTPTDEAALTASVRVGTEPIFRLLDFQAKVDATTSVIARARAGTGESTGVSGCQVLNCALAGTQEVCCADTQFSVFLSNCAFEEDPGEAIVLNGLFVLESDDVNVCKGFIPIGSSFTASLSSFTHDVFSAGGSFRRTSQEVTEVLEVAEGGCAVRQPERFGFDLRGDGRRFIFGELREFQVDSRGNVRINNESDIDALAITVGSQGEPDRCTVTAALDGSVSIGDFVVGTRFSTDFTDFHVVQPPEANALLLELNGTVGTDCLGDLRLSTEEPLRVALGDACFTSGLLEVQLEGGTVSTTYIGGGGLVLDFGDVTAARQFAACTDVPVDRCSTSLVGLCGDCTAATACQPGLACFPCIANCTGNTARCSLFDAVITCEDGIF